MFPLTDKMVEVFGGVIDNVVKKNGFIGLLLIGMMWQADRISDKNDAARQLSDSLARAERMADEREYRALAQTLILLVQENSKREAQTVEAIRTQTAVQDKTNTWIGRLVRRFPQYRDEG